MFVFGDAVATITDLEIVVREIVAIALRQAEQVVPVLDQRIELAALVGDQRYRNLAQPVAAPVAQRELVAVVFRVYDEALAGTGLVLQRIGDVQAVVDTPAVGGPHRHQRRQVYRLQDRVQLAGRESGRRQAFRGRERQQQGDGATNPLRPPHSHRVRGWP